MRILFYDDLKQNAAKYAELVAHAKDNFMANHKLFLDSHFILKSYWYGALYVVLEGFDDLKLADVHVNRLRNEEFIKKLKLFRNGTFHYQKHLYSSKIMGVDDTDEFVDWVRSLHSTLGKAILKQMAAQVPAHDSDKIFEQIKESAGTDLKQWISE
jgi:hypothetical protein